MVDSSLRHLYRPGMTPEELYGYYQDFGDDPFIVSSGSRCDVSAWSYAKSRCAAICLELQKNEAGNKRDYSHAFTKEEKLRCGG